MSGTVALAIPGQSNQGWWRDFSRDCKARGLRDTTLAAYGDAPGHWPLAGART